MFQLKLRYLFVFLLAAITFVSTELCEVYFYFHLEISWYYAFATILAITISTWEVNRLLFYLLRLNSEDLKKPARQLAVYFILGSAGVTMATTAIVFFMSMVVTDHTLEQSLVPLKLNLIYAWLANLLLHLINTIFIYFHQFQQQKVEAEKLQTMSVQAELQLIKNQVNPHFLFNNLNVLSTLILKNNSNANRFIEEFSKVYRYILHNQQKELVALQTEMYYLRPYLYLLQTRFGDGLKVVVDIDERYNDYYIIPAALQMLLENAIKHNIIDRSQPLQIAVATSTSGSVIVTNNISLKDSVERSTGIGLSNIIKRFALVTPRQVNISEEHELFTVELPLLEKQF